MSAGNRRRLAALVVGAVVLAVAAVTAIDHSTPAARDRPNVQTVNAAPVPPSNPASPAESYQTPTVTPAGGATQERIDGELSQAEGAPPAPLPIPPAPGYSAAYPAIPAVDQTDPAAYAKAFVGELVATDYATQPRWQLLAWAQAESAPDTLPGVPPEWGSQSLVASLATGSGPVPGQDGWVTKSSAGVSQSVSALQVQPNPAWLSLISAGWRPVDPAMTIVTVTGALLIHAGKTESQQRFSMQLTLGSDRYRSGYGAVAVDDWSVA